MALPAQAPLTRLWLGDDHGENYEKECRRLEFSRCAS